MESCKTEKLNVLILAAGLGTRLRPLTNDIPKPLVPVVDKSILEQQAIKARGISKAEKVCPERGVRLHANAHYLAEQVVAEGERLGFEKVWVEPEILGTAGPLKRIYNEGYRGGLLIMNGDAYCGFDLKAFVENATAAFAAGTQNGAVLGASQNGAAGFQDSAAPGVALLAVDFPKVNTFRVGEDGRLNGVAGRFGLDEGRAATFSGVSYYSDEALARIKDGEFDIREFWKQEIAAGRPPFVDMSQLNATWIDMGSPEGLWDATAARLKELGVDRWDSAALTVDSAKRSIVFAGASVADGEIVENEIRGKDFSWKI